MRNRKLRYFSKAEEADLDLDDGGEGGGGSGGADNPWPDTWRENYAGEDEGKLEALSRYASPSAAFDGLIATKGMIRSGEYKKVSEFPTEGTDEEKSSWREGNGIPVSADKYDLSFKDGLVIGENDKPIIDDFLEFAHSGNMSPKDAQSAIEWHYHNEEKIVEAMAESDAKIQSETEDALRAEWGTEYRANVNRINGLLDTAPEGVKDKIWGARFDDGSPLSSDQGALKWLIDMALQINPATTLIHGAGDNIAGAIEDEMKNFEGMMGNKNSEYWKGPKAEGNQKRYLELTKAKEKMK